MTMERILDLAHTAALEAWARASDERKEMPKNKIRQRREQRRWKELIEIEKIRRDLSGEPT